MGIEDIKLNIVEGGDDIPGDIYREVLIHEEMLNLAYVKIATRYRGFQPANERRVHSDLRIQAIDNLEESGHLVWPEKTYWDYHRPQIRKISRESSEDGQIVRREIKQWSDDGIEWFDF